MKSVALEEGCVAIQSQLRHWQHLGYTFVQLSGGVLHILRVHNSELPKIGIEQLCGHHSFLGHQEKKFKSVSLFSVALYRRDTDGKIVIELRKPYAVSPTY
nr:hypothetical protein [Tanacetum cinerariifolium]